jgi:DNA-binding NarL/FixJ family response regulator
MTHGTPNGQTAQGTVRVVVIEDLREVREGLSVLINGTQGFTCPTAYRTMEAALEGMSAAAPDVILTDIGLPGMDGIEGTRLLHERFPDRRQSQDRR